MLTALADSLAFADLLRSFSQDNRLLSLSFDGETHDDALVVARLSGQEALSECYRFSVECLCADQRVELKSLQGRRASVVLAGGAGGERCFNGVVTQVQALGADGGSLGYRLTLEPTFALLGHVRSAKVFQELSVPDAIDAELKHWQAGIADLDWRWALSSSYPVRSYIALYDESPLSAIDRLTREEGIYYYFEHLPAEAGRCARQRIVFTDDTAQLPSNAQPRVPFKRAAATDPEDSIDLWQATRHIVPGRVTLMQYDYKHPGATSTSEQTLHEHGNAAHDIEQIEEFQPHSAYYGSGANDLARYARLRMQAHEAAAKIINGEGSARSFIPGSSFEPQGHYDFPAVGGDNAFVLLSVEHDARNNLPREFFNGARASEQTGVFAPDEAGYRNRFTAQRKSVPYRPAFDRERHAKPRAPSLQSAIVVGPHEGEVHTDELGRIRVRFHWDREGKSSLWLRVLTSVAGERWGQIALPRVGTEVLVGYVESDIDRPVVLGSLYEADHRPPSFSGAGSLPANRHLSGFKSQEIRGSGYGELLFDDTTGQTKTKLSSEHGKTQLNQGWIGHPRSEGESDRRGEGFELRTDLSGALRAAQLLISTELRQGASGATLNRDELLGCLDTALSISKQLAELATTHQADTTDTQAQSDLREGIAQWDASPGKASGAAAIAVSAPGGIVQASAKSIQASAGTNLDFTAAQDANLSTGRKILLRAAQGIAAFAHKQGMKFIAAGGDWLAQAQAGNLVLGAAERLHAYALKSLLLEAPEGLFKVGGCEIKMANGVITFSASTGVVMDAPNFGFGGSYSGQLDLPGMPASAMTTDERIALAGRGGQARATLPYEIADGEGAILQSAQSAGDGATQSLVTDTAIKSLFMKLKP